MSALRAFTAYTNTAPVSPSILIDPTGTATKTLTFPCVLVNLDGIAADAGYFQVFDLATAPTSTVTVPLMSMRVAAGGPLPSFFPALGGITLSKGLYVAMSSTDQVYTAVSTAFDVFGAVDEFEVAPSGLTVVTGSGVSGKRIWNNSTGPKRIYRLEISGTFDAADFLQVFADDTPAAFTVPIAQWPFQSPNGTAVSSPWVLNFGAGGYAPMHPTLDGCFFSVSTTSNSHVPDGAVSLTITGYYK